MTLKIDSLQNLDAESVEQAHAQIRQIVQEYNPSIYVQNGAIDDVVLHTGGILEAATQDVIEKHDQARSLLKITQDPEVAELGTVDAVLSNFGLTRKEGTQSAGTVTIVLSRLNSVTVARGAVFEADGLSFTSDEAYTARTTSSAVVSATDRLLVALGGGEYAFTISVTAAENGEAYRLTKGTALVPTNRPQYFVRALAASDFTGGSDQETNTALLARQAEGITAKVLAGRTSMVATLRDQESFSDFIASSIVGMQNQEMLRDKHNVMGISTGGRVDWYIRTQERPQLLSIDAEATLIEKTSDGRGIWQFEIDRDAAPGFYDVVEIKPTSAEYVGTYEVISDTRGYDLSESDSLPDFMPDIADASEAAYTRFQTAVIKFKDDDTLTADLTVNSSTQDYPVTVRIMPLIGEIQDWASGLGTHHPAGDVLVKAPVPCFVRLSFTVERKDDTQEPDYDSIKNALAEKVNKFGFTGRLPASALTDVVHSYLTEDQYCRAIDMFGTILRPDGTKKLLRSSELLEVPSEPADMVTSRTVGFILTPSDIAISDVIVDIPDTE